MKLKNVSDVIKELVCGEKCEFNNECDKCKYGNAIKTITSYDWHELDGALGNYKDLPPRNMVVVAQDIFGDSFTAKWDNFWFAYNFYNVTPVEANAPVVKWKYIE